MTDNTMTESTQNGGCVLCVPAANITCFAPCPRCDRRIDPPHPDGRFSFARLRKAISKKSRDPPHKFCWRHALPGSAWEQNKLDTMVAVLDSAKLNTDMIKMIMDLALAPPTPAERAEAAETLGSFLVRRCAGRRKAVLDAKQEAARKIEEAYWAREDAKWKKAGLGSAPRPRNSIVLK